jgi:hypothetical protein
MRFIIQVNPADPDGNGSVTLHAVETGSESRRTNRRKLRDYFHEMGVATNEMKRVFKEMGFVGKGLGTKK